MIRDLAVRLLGIDYFSPDEEVRGRSYGHGHQQCPDQEVGVEEAMRADDVRRYLLLFLNPVLVVLVRGKVVREDANKNAVGLMS